MEPKELQSRLTQLSLGKTVLLSEKEFHEVFHVFTRDRSKETRGTVVRRSVDGSARGLRPGPHKPQFLTFVALARGREQAARTLSVYASELLSTVMVKKGTTAQAMPKTANAMTGS
jgi:hypothetical protein